MALLAQYKGLKVAPPQTVAPPRPKLPTLPTKKEIIVKVERKIPGYKKAYRKAEERVAAMIPTLDKISQAGAKFAQAHPTTAHKIYTGFEKAHIQTQRYGTSNQRQALAGYTYGSYQSLQTKPIKTSAMFGAGLVGGRAISAIGKVGKAFGAGAKAARMAKATELGLLGIYGVQTTHHIMSAPTPYRAGQRAADAMYTEILPMGVGALAARPLAKIPRDAVKKIKPFTKKALAPQFKKFMADERGTLGRHGQKKLTPGEQKFYTRMATVYKKQYGKSPDKAIQQNIIDTINKYRFSQSIRITETKLPPSKRIVDAKDITSKRKAKIEKGLEDGSLKTVRHPGRYVKNKQDQMEYVPESIQIVKTVPKPAETKIYIEITKPKTVPKEWVKPPKVTTKVKVKQKVKVTPTVKVKQKVTPLIAISPAISYKEFISIDNAFETATATAISEPPAVIPPVPRIDYGPTPKTTIDYGPTPETIVEIANDFKMMPEPPKPIPPKIIKAPFPPIEIPKLRLVKKKKAVKVVRKVRKEYTNYQIVNQIAGINQLFG